MHPALVVESFFDFYSLGNARFNEFEVQTFRTAFAEKSFNKNKNEFGRQVKVEVSTFLNFFAERSHPHWVLSANILAHLTKICQYLCDML